MTIIEHIQESIQVLLGKGCKKENLEIILSPFAELRLIQEAKECSGWDVKTVEGIFDIPVSVDQMETHRSIRIMDRAYFDPFKQAPKSVRILF